MQPLVSIVIPVHNDGAFLPEALDSVRPARARGHEVIVVDDGSTDPQTLALLERLRKEGWTVLRQENLGCGAARNTGIRASRGAFLLSMDADNKLEPALIDRALEVFAREPRVGIVYPDLRLFGERSGIQRPPPFDPAALHLRNYIDVGTVIRREVWEEAGGFDSQLWHQSDWGLWLAALEKGWRFYHIPEPLYHYRVRAGSLIRNVPVSQQRQELMHLHAKHSYYTLHGAELFARQFLRQSELENECELLRQQARLHRRSLWMRTGQWLGLVPDLRPRIRALSSEFTFTLEQPRLLLPGASSWPIQGSCSRNGSRPITALRARSGATHVPLSCEPCPSGTQNSIVNFAGSLPAASAGPWILEAQETPGTWQPVASIHQRRPLFSRKLT